MIFNLAIAMLLVTSTIARPLNSGDKCMITTELEESTNARLQTLKIFDANINLKCVDMSVKFTERDGCVVTCPFVHDNISYNMHGSTGDNFVDFYLHTVNKVKEVCEIEEGGDICAGGAVRDC